jgi:threonyl-tRNA synthetase
MNDKYRLADHFDQVFHQMAVAAGAREVLYPERLPASLLEKADYFESFSETAVPAGAGTFFQPAVCYQVYEQLAGRCLDTPLTLTSVGRCRRNEKSCDDARLREFTMREVVLVGPAPWVEAQRRSWSVRVLEYVAGIGLEASLEVATDPFFTSPTMRGKKLLQQLKELKLELQAGIGDDRRTALASFNLHETFFCRRFQISLSDGSPAVSACVAFGLERWSLAAIRQLGASARAWDTMMAQK